MPSLSQAEDIALSYTLYKNHGIRSMVVAQPHDDRSYWGVSENLGTV